MTYKLVQGDCVQAMRDAASRGNKVHAIVTDPPYHLSTAKRFAKTSTSDDTVTGDRSRRGADGYARLAKGFMGKEWDGGGVAFEVDTWRAAYDLLPPGGHLVAFSSSRTYHRMACAIEDAGFEIRDQLMWLYGSGFPKSHDVAKGIDKMDVVGPLRERALKFTAWMRTTGLTANQINDITDTCMGSHYLTDKEQPQVAVEFEFEKLRPHLPEVPAYVQALVDSRTVESENLKRRAVVGTKLGKDTTKVRPGLPLQDGTLTREFDVTVAHTEEAARWEGWGTALKPAHEPIVLARKPLDGTVAANVVEHGTGAINVDACRVHHEDVSGPRTRHGGGIKENHTSFHLPDQKNEQPPGRWPANVVHDGSDEVEEEFAKYGETKSSRSMLTSKPGDIYGGGAGLPSHTGLYGFNDKGTPSRFYYAAKASKKERQGSKHPTVKPVALMRWLVRMVTPPGGIVLDPFAGTGTTGQAALEEGFRCVLIEREEEYVADIRKRLDAVNPGSQPAPVRQRKRVDK